jgi:hypothetical protein
MADTMHAWATFAKDPQKGLISLGWPVYDENSKSELVSTRVPGANEDAEDTLIRIGYNNQSALNLGPAKQYDTLCSMMSMLTGMAGGRGGT